MVYRPRSPAPRRGIALIVTLGLLFVVLLIAFSFSVSMHTERLASGAHLDGSWARQAIFQPLTLAQRDIQHNVGIYPYWADPATFAMTSAKKPSNPFEYGKRPIQGMEAFACYLPSSVRDDMLNVLPSLYWYNLFHLGDLFTGQNFDRSIFTGYPVCPDVAVCGAVMVNCSGFLDVHKVGRPGKAVRGFGTNAAEIVTDHLPSQDVDILNSAAFQADNIVESFPEMTMKGNSDSANLFVYSHFPLGQYWSTKKKDDGKAGVVNCAYVGGSSSSAWDPTNLTVSLDHAGFTSKSDQDQVISAFAEYVDGDYVPNGASPACYEHGSQEPVAGFNEWAIETTYDCEIQSENGTNFFVFNLSATPHVEIFSGHLKSDTARYTARIGCSFDPIKVPSGFTASSTTLNPSTNLPSPAFADLSQLMFSITSDRITDPDIASNAMEIVYRLRFGATLNRAGPGGGTVDMMKQFDLTLTNSLARLPNAGSETTNQWLGLHECLDPRFNWDVSATNQWRSEASHTLGSNNTWAVEYVGNTNNQADGDFMMYCANAAMKTVGEIGYLVYAPWQTIRLCVSPSQRWYHTNALSAFTLYTNTVAKGLVNPNTEHEAVLGCVFDQMPLDLYPGGPSNRLDWADATKISGSIWDHVYGDPGVPKFFWNVADIGGVTNLFCGEAASIGATNDFLRESILRNSAGLLNTRQQLYTFFLVSSYVPGFDNGYVPIGPPTNSPPDVPANPTKDPPGIAADTDQPRVSERRAVAVFWRDAWTGESFLRFFKMLDPSDFE